MPSFPIAGVRVGHATQTATGVTVMLFPAGSVGSGEVRGGAPATREMDLLDPTRSVARIDAVTLSGGSAFGLATADGVMRYLAERGQGFPTAGGAVPIVPTACIFDIAESDAARPGADDGYAASVAAARDEPWIAGRVGAGTGATVGKWRGREGEVPGGIGVAAASVDGFTVAALAVVNAVGDVVAADGSIVAGSTMPDALPFPTAVPFEEERRNTTLVVVVTDAVLDKVSCFLLAESAHDGLARALHPSHTRYDGDCSMAVATGTTTLTDDPNLDRLRVAATDVVAGAVRAARLANLPPFGDPRSSVSSDSHPAPGAGTTLKQVAAAAQTCAECKLAGNRTQVVFGVGRPDADLMFVGEGPGEQEDLKGEPFVGRAGQLLTQLIEGIGLTRADVYIANVVKCRPPGNRDPQPDEIAACAPWLDRQLELIRPKVIVTLGNFATKLILQTKEGITKIRGQEFSFSRAGLDVVVIPTLHPSAVLRTGGKTLAESRADFVHVKRALANAS